MGNKRPPTAPRLDRDGNPLDVPSETDVVTGATTAVEEFNLRDPLHAFVAVQSAHGRCKVAVDSLEKLVKPEQVLTPRYVRDRIANALEELGRARELLLALTEKTDDDDRPG